MTKTFAIALPLSAVLLWAVPAAAQETPAGPAADAMWPNSTISGGTWRSASMVSRTIGGMAKITVAISAETGLKPKRKRIGTR